VIVVGALAIFAPLAVQGQELTADQQEVWNVVLACYDANDSDALMACYHDDFLGWGLDNTVPMNKADKQAINARVDESSENMWQHLKPVSVDVRGDVAIVLYVQSYVDRDKTTGEETAGTVNWTDILVKVGERWLWLADHGTQVDDN
jgi:ketosteroid isomerase-like protein